MASMEDLEVLDYLESKRLVLRREVEATGGLMVAFSGGVDSSLLLAAAVEALGPRAVAATGVSPSLAERELEDERAEALVRSFGLAQLRVRDHGELARVEVPVDALPLLVREDARGRLVEGLRELGFAYVTLDLEGFRSGSMNAAVRP